MGSDSSADGYKERYSLYTQMIMRMNNDSYEDNDDGSGGGVDDDCEH